jgi:hypothetical protein
LDEQNSLEVLDSELDALAQEVGELQELDADHQDLTSALTTMKKEITEMQKKEFRGLSQASLSVHLKSSCDGATSGTAAWFDPLGTRFEP